MKKSKIIFVLIIIVIFGSSLMSYPYDSAQSSVNNFSIQEELDQFILENVNMLNIPRMSIAISHQGELIYSEVFGEDIQTDTMFYIGSITKSITALAVMQLVEQEMIDLDESVSTYIEEFTVSDKITVRHLLHHVSGMTESNYIAKLSPQSEFSDLIQDMNGRCIEHRLLQKI